MKANVSWSVDENEEVAGRVCAKKAVIDLIQTKLCILYSSEKYNTEKLLNGAKTVLGTAPIIGATSSDGICVPDGYITSQNGFAGMMCIGDNDTAVGTAISEKVSSARETGRIVAKEAMKKVGTEYAPSFFMMIATPGEEEEYLKGIQDIIGNVPVFGGTASDDEMTGKWKIYNEDKIVSDGVCVAFFYTNKRISNILESRYHETINSGVITKVTGKREIDEIEGIQALKQYAEWTNKKVKDVKGGKILKESILKPLAVKTLDGSLLIIREPMNGNTDYSINMSNDVCVNTTIIQAQISKEELIASPKLIARELNEVFKKDKAFYIIEHSALRKQEVEGNINELARMLKEELGDTPFIMPFTFGEYGSKNHSQNLCGSLMISMTAFGK